MLSAYSHREVVAKQFESDCQKGITMAPFPHKTLHKYSNLFLTFPPLVASVNNGIHRKRVVLPLTPRYVDEIADTVLHKGSVSKIDVKSVSQSVCLPVPLAFWLESAPKILNALADTLEWVIRQQGMNHY